MPIVFFLWWSASLIQLWILFLNDIFFYLCYQAILHLVPASLGAVKNYIFYAPLEYFEYSINLEHLPLTASTFLTGYRNSSTALDFLSTVVSIFFLLSSEWDFQYASQRSVGLLFLFSSSISVSLLLTAGAPSTIFDVAWSASKLINPSTDHVPRTLSTFLEECFIQL